MKRYLILFLCFLSGVTLAQEKIPLQDFLSSIEENSQKEFFYKPKWIEAIEVPKDALSSENFLPIIEDAIESFGLSIYIHNEHNIFIYPNKIELERQAILDAKPNVKRTNALRIGNPSDFDANNYYELKGIVDSGQGEKLIGVNILVDGVLVTKSNQDGVYSLNLKPGNYELKYSYVGLEAETRLLTFYSTGMLNVSLFKGASLLDEVIVEVGLSDDAGSGASVGVQKIGLTKLERLPSFAGEVDIVKGVTSLPGVTVSGESSSYLNIRGGSNDQTLTLMNNSTIYNPGHLLGFFSVFNGDFVSDVTIYKGNIPAKYGVRASSVLDVKMNKWATKKWQVHGGIGLINSSLGVKTKLLDDRLDLHVGGRLSYVNWMLGLVPDKNILRSSAHFGDMNFSSRFRIDDNSSLSFSSYYGKDFFNYSGRIAYEWYTFNNTLKWTEALSDDWILETEIVSSSLQNSSEGLEFNDEFVFDNGINELSLKGSISNSNIDAGFDLAQYRIEPGKISPTTSNSLAENVTLEKEEALNIGLFGSYLLSPAEGLEVSLGLRFNRFINYGPSLLNIYTEGEPFTEENIIGTRSVASGSPSSIRNSFEPRFGIKYNNNNSTIRAGYSRINQFLHLISNTVLVNPSTVWKASDQFIPPTKIDQFSVGYQYDFLPNDVSVSVDVFYKESEDLVEYRNGAKLLLNPSLEQEIVSGVGESYGIEFLISKNKGFLTGLASYTYSRSFISVNDIDQEVKINSGDKYPFYSDRPHNFKASLDFKLSKKWTLSSNFSYISGAPISAPVNIFEIDGVKVPYFSERNSERIPDYHRLDLVVTLKSRIRKTKKNNDRWVLTLYNVYGRDNIATIFFSSENDIPAQPFGLVNVGRMVPTITYKFEF